MMAYVTKKIKCDVTEVQRGYSTTLFNHGSNHTAAQYIDENSFDHLQLMLMYEHYFTDCGDQVLSVCASFLLSLRFKNKTWGLTILTVAILLFSLSFHPHDTKPRPSTAVHLSASIQTFMSLSYFQ
jgi:hypothetical protein